MTNRLRWQRYFRMHNVIKCSFCQKHQGMARDIGASTQTVTASICHDCLNVYRGILKKEIKRGAESGSYRISSSRQDLVEPLCCSFCDTPQQIVDKQRGRWAPTKTKHERWKILTAPDCKPDAAMVCLLTSGSLSFSVATQYGGSLLPSSRQIDQTEADPRIVIGPYYNPLFSSLFYLPGLIPTRCIYAQRK